MTSVIDSEEETIFINRITAGSASRVCNTTHLIYQSQRRSSKVRELHILAASADLKDKGAAEAISTNLFLPLRLYVVFTAWLFVFLASIIEKSPASFQESPANNDD